MFVLDLDIILFCSRSGEPNCTFRFRQRAPASSHLGQYGRTALTRQHKQS